MDLNDPRPETGTRFCPAHRHVLVEGKECPWCLAGNMAAKSRPGFWHLSAEDRAILAQHHLGVQRMLHEDNEDGA